MLSGGTEEMADPTRSTCTSSLWFRSWDATCRMKSVYCAILRVSSSKMSSESTCRRAGWVSMLLLESLRSAVQPPGPKNQQHSSL